MRLSKLAVAALSGAIVFAPLTVQAQSTGLEDLVGARAGQAEGELSRRGYRNVRGEKSDDRSYGYWWNDTRRQCVSIVTKDGRFDAITPTTAPDCRQAASTDQRRPRRDGDRDTRRGNDRDRNDTRGSWAPAPGALPQVCKDEAAATFGRPAARITTNAPIRQPYGFVVQGWFDKRGGGTTFFNCRFDADGRFLGVS